MSFPKKTKGWRTIIVDGEHFRWHFSSGGTSSLTLHGSNSSSQQAIIELKDWHDPWLFVPSHAHFPPHEPKIITAKFARQAIIFALRNGWKPSQPGVASRVTYEKQNFTVVHSESMSSI